MILSDVDILNMMRNKRLVIRPFNDETVRENGIDCRITGEVARHVRTGKSFVLDPSKKEHIAKAYRITVEDSGIVMRPHEQVLLSTHEYLEMPDDIAGFVELRSTWARHGLSMPPTIIDAGFKGTITLEVVNNAPYSILLRPMQRFAHIIFEKLDSRTGSGYSGFYFKQRGIKLPRVLK